jgi:hypothetical protein
LIVNLYVAVDLAIAFFALAVSIYAMLKAYQVDEGTKETNADSRYELEKQYYLVSTVGWLTFGARILAIPLFYVTLISLIPSVPGAMCEYGVLQAGAPFSWVALGVKLITMFVFGGWLFFDFINRQLKAAPLIGALSRMFVLIVPLLFVDAALDIAFFGSLQPLVVPCCMVIYSKTAGGLFNIGCPFCFVTYQYPLLWGVIPAYAVSIALIVWSYLFTRSSSGFENQKESAPLMKKTLLAAIVLAIIGTFLLLVQIGLGSFNT